jgi:hypothetical protein
VTALDLDALEAEALGRTEPASINYRGVELEFPPPAAWPISLMRRLQRDGDLGVLDEVMGKGAVGQLSDAGLTVAGLRLMLERLGVDIGSGPPLSESSAPSRSSNGTRKK